MSQSLRDDDGQSNPSTHPTLTDVVERAIAVDPRRRRLMLGGLGAATVPFLAGLAGCGSSDSPPPPAAAPAAPVERMIGFNAVGVSTGDAVVVPPGYVAQAMLPWGEPVDASAPAWKSDATNTAAEQERQVGDNHDGMAFFGFNAAGNGFGDRSDEGLLVINHEYINPEYFYAPDSDPADWLSPFTAEKARKGQAAHGITVAHVRREADGSWTHVRQSAYNRRIHGNTPIEIQGPAAGHPLMRTAADPAGTQALGTLNNCGNGRTPWGTYLTCEENFNGYFGSKTPATDANFTGTASPYVGNPATEAGLLFRRYGISDAGFGYRWHLVDDRFDVTVNPNEPNRHGWIVEIDPFAPTSRPVKRTALGRFKHENAEVVVAPDGRVVVYSGCDERNEYLWKFVSSGTFDRANPTSAANRRLLESGTLYVARFDAGATPGDNMGTGAWIPLNHGQNGLTSANGFDDAGEVMIKARMAGDRLGATMLDRPEWVAANPNRPGEVYVTLTNNNRRGSWTSSRPATEPQANAVDGTTIAGSARPASDEVNPRSNNVWGHIVRWNEANGNAGATTFTWDIFVLAGLPSVTDARRPSSNVTLENLFNSPDGLAFDAFGRMWIQTDGSFSNSGNFAGMGNNQMLVADPATKEIRRFMVGPSGCEVTGITWTPDRRTVFVNIQHPGEVSDHPRRPAGSTDNSIARNATAFSQWPTAGARPRSATVAIRRTDGGPVAG
jgi:secreted PhoX family phosphatase